jgi:hypothetical protein
MSDPSPDTFSAAIALIGMVVDPKATSARLAELQKQVEKATAAQAKLDSDRAAHERTAAADKVSAAEREKTLRDREVAVAIKERNIAAREKAMRCRRGSAPIRTCRPAPFLPAV